MIARLNQLLSAHIWMTGARYRMFRFCARILAKHGAKVRKERERERIHRICDEMRARHGLAPVRWS